MLVGLSVDLGFDVKRTETRRFRITTNVPKHILLVTLFVFLLLYDLFWERSKAFIRMMA